jgi:hypothetical protein
VENIQPLSSTDLAQTAEVWNRFPEVITDVPGMSQVEIDDLHQLTFCRSSKETAVSGLNSLALCPNMLHLANPLRVPKTSSVVELWITNFFYHPQTMFIVRDIVMVLLMYEVL